MGQQFTTDRHELDGQLVATAQRDVTPEAILTNLANIISEVAAAQVSLQAIRDRAQVSFTTLAQAQTAMRVAQGDMQTHAQVTQVLIKRCVALARVVLNQMNDDAGT